MEYDRFIRSYKKNQTHNLKIISLNDVNLECSCGMWVYNFTGTITREEASKLHQDHIEIQNQIK